MFNIGIIGCGKIAQVRHIPEYAGHPQARLAGFYDLNQERARELAEKWGGKAYSSWEEMLADPGIDAVSICVANNAHAQLSIAALRLGAEYAFACDIDEKCVDVAYENAALNGIGKDRYTVRWGNVLTDAALRQEMGAGYDIVVANIVADVIMGLSPHVRPFLKPDGLFLCSGIIDDRAAEVLEKLKADGWDVFEQRSSEGWFSYLCK